jgi:beta-galactosidase/beta-glucuronidase
MKNFLEFRASDQDGSYCRPQLVRPDLCELGGAWEFAFDDDNKGIALGWQTGDFTLANKINVPFPPESKLSGIGDTGYHRVLWYRRLISSTELKEAGLNTGNERVFINFGAVDYRAQVWLNGRLIAVHEGGHVSFRAELTGALAADNNVLVVRVEDDPVDVTQPRGKQDWLAEPHVIWYDRTSGIWQPVWLEAVGRVHIEQLHWTTNTPGSLVNLEILLDQRPVDLISVQLELSINGQRLGTTMVMAGERRIRISVEIPQQFNGQAYQDLLWSPESPVLIDADIKLTDSTGELFEQVKSYFGIRSVSLHDGKFLLNDRPVFVRAVLEQGFWPQSHLAAPSATALKEEVEVIKALGFNTARVHQKIEDPRFLYWADKLGLMIWGEFPATFEFSNLAVSRVVEEWSSAVERDRSHPSIVVWVPMNESWGVQHIAESPAQEHFARALYSVTKALDQTRPVISNDGWEHAESDLVTVHDYEANAAVLEQRYSTPEAIAAILGGIGPAGRRMFVGNHRHEGQPVLLSEFGGIAFKTGHSDKDWGYSHAKTDAEFETLLIDMFAAVGKNSALAGFCYTQLTDTMQEINGLLDENRKPKIAIEKIRAAVTEAGS